MCPELCSVLGLELLLDCCGGLYRDGDNVNVNDFEPFVDFGTVFTLLPHCPSALQTMLSHYR